jgi:hypothetical protein
MERNEMEIKEEYQVKTSKTFAVLENWMVMVIL